MIYDGVPNTAIFLRQLRRLIKDTDRKLFVIADDLRMYWAKIVTACAAEHPDAQGTHAGRVEITSARTATSADKVRSLFQAPDVRYAI